MMARLFIVEGCAKVLNAQPEKKREATLSVHLSRVINLQMNIEIRTCSHSQHSIGHRGEDGRTNGPFVQVRRLETSVTCDHRDFILVYIQGVAERQATPDGELNYQGILHE